MQTRWLVLVASCAVLLAACSASEKKLQAAETAVSRFHAHLNANRFDAIYAEATDEFRNSASRAEYEQFIRAVREKLGRVTKTDRKSWTVNVMPDGTRVVLTYDAVFENGAAVEEFTFRAGKSGPRLLGFQINSPLLDARGGS